MNCPHCGRQIERSRRVMEVDPDAPGLWKLLNGEGEPAMQVIAWTATILFSAFVLGFILNGVMG